MDVVLVPKTPNDFGLRMKGILASTAQAEGLSLGATIYIYCNGKKLNANTGESFIDLEYRCVNGDGRWVALGWFRDEYGEYSEFDDL